MQQERRRISWPALQPASSCRSHPTCSTPWQAGSNPARHSGHPSRQRCPAPAYLRSRGRCPQKSPACFARRSQGTHHRTYHGVRQLQRLSPHQPEQHERQGQQLEPHAVQPDPPNGHPTHHHRHRARWTCQPWAAAHPLSQPHTPEPQTGWRPRCRTCISWDTFSEAQHEWPRPRPTVVWRSPQSPERYPPCRGARPLPRCQSHPARA